MGPFFQKKGKPMSTGKHINLKQARDEDRLDALI